jgi:hypothetical protein
MPTKEVDPSPEAIAVLIDIRVRVKDLLTSIGRTLVESDMGPDEFLAATISAGLELAVQFCKIRNMRELHRAC